MLPTQFHHIEEMFQDLADWKKALMPAKVFKTIPDVEKMLSF